MGCRLGHGWRWVYCAHCLQNERGRHRPEGTPALLPGGHSTRPACLPALPQLNSSPPPLPFLLLQAAKEAKLAERRKAEEDRKARRRMLGNIIFVGQLYLTGSLTEGVIHTCIRQLLDEVRRSLFVFLFLAGWCAFGVMAWVCGCGGWDWGWGWGG
jgi:hypothetical protein